MKLRNAMMPYLPLNAARFRCRGVRKFLPSDSSTRRKALNRKFRNISSKCAIVRTMLASISAKRSSAEMLVRDEHRRHLTLLFHFFLYTHKRCSRVSAIYDLPWGTEAVLNSDIASSVKTNPLERLIAMIAGAFNVVKSLRSSFSFSPSFVVRRCEIMVQAAVTRIIRAREKHSSAHR